MTYAEKHNIETHDNVYNGAKVLTQHWWGNIPKSGIFGWDKYPDPDDYEFEFCVGIWRVKSLKP